MADVHQFLEALLGLDFGFEFLGVVVISGLVRVIFVVPVQLLHELEIFQKEILIDIHRDVRFLGLLGLHIGVILAILVIFIVIFRPFIYNFISLVIRAIFAVFIILRFQIGLLDDDIFLV